jgi:hypothetical protein
LTTIASLLNGTAQTGHQQEAQKFFKFRLSEALVAGAPTDFLAFLNDAPMIDRQFTIGR